MSYLKFLMLALAVTSSATVHASGLILGLVVGLLLGGNGHDQSTILKQSGLNAIPLRCLAVESQLDYTDCRWTSMMAELQAARNNAYLEIPAPYCEAHLGLKDKWQGNPLLEASKGHARACDVDWHIQLEFKALKGLNDSLAAQQKQSNPPN